MAYPEKRGDGPTPWRVKYMTPSGERSRSGFATEQAAKDWGLLQEAEIRAKKWNDPRKGDLLLQDWVAQWNNSQDLAETTEENYAYHLRTHILPAFGKRSLSSLDTLEIEAWQRDIRKRKYAASSAKKARSLLSTILDDAVTAKLITTNPAHTRRRRGRQDIHATSSEESLWCTPNQALTIAERIALLAGRWDEALMFLLAAYTGMRFGEVRGLERQYAWLGAVRVEWQLREVNGVFLQAPPKHNGRRTIPLPPFLADLMSDQLRRTASSRCECKDHQGDYLFRPQGKLEHHSRTGFANQWFRPAADGRLVAKGGRQRSRVMVDEAGRYVPRRRGETLERTATRAVATWCPVVEGLTFHDAKHGHKTWMIGDGIPEVAQFERLGHRMGGIRGVYSHVDPVFRQQILDALQARWEKSLEWRARFGPSRVPELQALLEPQLRPWKLISQIPPTRGAKIISIGRGLAV
ncbi:site-specific integrase [Streptosporangium sp. NPDC049078]|uniref:tyrosine-type recombinase/integrase n=1 Tax=Streptosporangium sp. NPDC049078 TaxID=3155767 RepID=UPI003419A29A